MADCAGLAKLMPYFDISRTLQAEYFQDLHSNWVKSYFSVCSEVRYYAFQQSDCEI